MSDAITDRVRRAWCDYDHDSEVILSTDDAELWNLSPTWCRHGYAKPWKSGESEWGLEGWLALLAFVADDADDVTHAEFRFHGLCGNHEMYGDDECYGADVTWDTDERPNFAMFRPRTDDDDDEEPPGVTFVESPPEAVIRAIDAIEQHREQEGE